MRPRQRRSIRLKGYDYTQPGAYFVTIVTLQRQSLFGEVVDGRMVLSPWGQIAQQEWLKTAELRENVELFEDQFIVMPNHIHGIIWIIDSVRRDTAAPRRTGTAPPRRTGTAPPCPYRLEAFGKPVSGSLPTVVRAYKSAVSYQVNALRGTKGAPLWQRNYYEHVIRSETELSRITAYIQMNPDRWSEDLENPFRD